MLLFFFLRIVDLGRSGRAFKKVIRLGQITVAVVLCGQLGKVLLRHFIPHALYVSHDIVHYMI